jgi:hypothetical protein
VRFYIEEYTALSPALRLSVGEESILSDQYRLILSAAIPKRVYKVVEWATVYTIS